MVDPFIEFFLQHRKACVVFELPLLMLCDLFVFCVGVDDLGTDKDDHVVFYGETVIFAEDGADDGEASQTGDGCSEMGLAVVDHST